MMTFYLILFGGITAFAVAIVLLDWLGRRQERQQHGPGR
jgi:hypothetical protein